MTKLEMKKEILALIEELNPESEYLTQDPDISAKIDSVINHIMFEVVRFRKLPKYIEMEVNEGDVVTFADLEKECGNEIYQIDLVRNIKHSFRADGTVIKFLESGTAEIDVFVFPERITEKTKDKSYEFELPADSLEIMIYGVAADLLKSDESAQFGQNYAIRYSDMMSRLDSRYAMPSIQIEGGVVI